MATNSPITEKEVNIANIEDAKKYLDNTDWYYIRKEETALVIPADVVTKRQEARVVINDLEAANDLIDSAT